MRMARRMTVGVCGVLIALFATGCTSPDQIQIETLQKKVQDLDAENANLRERLASGLESGLLGAPFSGSMMTNPSARL